MNELNKGGLINTAVSRIDGLSLAEAIDKYDITKANPEKDAEDLYKSAPGNKFNLVMGSQNSSYPTLDTDRENGCIRSMEHAYTKDGGLAILKGNIALNGCCLLYTSSYNILFISYYTMIKR